jgi:hypothetical protein
VDLAPWADGAVEALWAELSRRESCLGAERGKLVRVAHAVRVRVVAGDRCVLRVRGLEADKIDTRTFLGATLPVLQKSSGRVCTCVEIKISRRVRAESSRRPPRHRRDASSMAWRCRFLIARRSQHGRVVAEK